MISAANHESYVASILATYGRATTDQILQGRTWYPVGGHAATWIGHGNMRRGAGMIAALSPMQSWAANLATAQALSDGTGGKLSAFPANVVKARRIMAGEDFTAVLRPGTKTYNFAANLAGDTHAVTVDRWARRVATGEVNGDADAKMSPRQYETLAAAYRDAAARAGETPSAMQAVTWIVARGSGD